MSLSSPDSLCINDLPELCLSMIMRKLPFKDRHMLARTVSDVWRMCTGNKCEPGILGEIFLDGRKSGSFVTDLRSQQPAIGLLAIGGGEDPMPSILRYLERHLRAFDMINLAFDVVENADVCFSDLLDVLRDMDEGALFLDFRLLRTPNERDLEVLEALTDLAYLPNCASCAIELNSLNDFVQLPEDLPVAVSNLNAAMLETALAVPNDEQLANIESINIHYVEVAIDSVLSTFPALQELFVGANYGGPIFDPAHVPEYTSLETLIVGNDAPPSYYTTDTACMDLPLYAQAFPQLKELSVNVMVEGGSEFSAFHAADASFPTVTSLRLGINSSDGSKEGPEISTDFGLYSDVVNGFLRSTPTHFPALQSATLVLLPCLPPNFPSSHPDFRFTYFLHDLIYLPPTLTSLRIELRLDSDPIYSTLRTDPESRKPHFEATKFAHLRGPQTMTLHVSSGSVAHLTALRSLSLDVEFEDALQSVPGLSLDPSVSFTCSVDVGSFKAPPFMQLTDQQEETTSKDEPKSVKCKVVRKWVGANAQ